MSGKRSASDEQVDRHGARRGTLTVSCLLIAGGLLGLGCRSMATEEASRPGASNHPSPMTAQQQTSGTAKNPTPSAEPAPLTPTASETTTAKEDTSGDDTPANSAANQTARNATPEQHDKANDAPQEQAPEATAAAKGVKRVYRVAAMGDSLTDPKVGGGRFLRYLRERCPKSEFDSYGVGGEMVNQMRRRFHDDIVAGRTKKENRAYNHVIVFGGVNDLYSDLTANRKLDRIENDLSAMYRAAKQIGITVTAITVTPWGGFKRYYNERRGKNTLTLNAWITKQAAEGFVDFVVDAYPLLSCGDPERLCPELSAPFRDGIHFGPKGHEKLGKALYEQVFSDCL